jgi:hypothetical protein
MSACDGSALPQRRANIIHARHNLDWDTLIDLSYDCIKIFDKPLGITFTNIAKDAKQVMAAEFNGAWHYLH